MAMKKLEHRSQHFQIEHTLERKTNPNVAPDPAIYCPSVRMTPFCPAPYLIMFTVPDRRLAGTPQGGAAAAHRK